MVAFAVALKFELNEVLKIESDGHACHGIRTGAVEFAATGALQFEPSGEEGAADGAADEDARGVVVVEVTTADDDIAELEGIDAEPAAVDDAAGPPGRVIPRDPARVTTAFTALEAGGRTGAASRMRRFAGSASEVEARRETIKRDAARVKTIVEVRSGESAGSGWRESRSEREKRFYGETSSHSPRLAEMACTRYHRARELDGEVPREPSEPVGGAAAALRSRSQFERAVPALPRVEQDKMPSVCPVRRCCQEPMARAWSVVARLVEQDRRGDGGLAKVGRRWADSRHWFRR